MKVTPNQALGGHRAVLFSTRRTAAFIGLVAGSALALSACGSDNATSGASPSGSTSAAVKYCATGNISGGGSTFQQNIELQWIKDYQAKCAGSTIAYAGTGSGAGKTAFGNNTVDFAGSDSNMNDTEQAAANARCAATNYAIQIPITAGAAVLVYNLPSVKNLQLSASTIGGIFGGTITKWDDAAIKADNPGTTLPSTTIVPVHRSDKSGTTNIFSSFLKSNAGSSWTLGSGETLTWPGGQSGNGSTGTTAAVKQAEGGITYAELSFAKLDNLPIAKVKNASGAFIEPNGKSVSAGLADATIDPAHKDVRAVVNYATMNKDAYPLSAVTYVIACNAGNKSAALLKGYFTYALTDGTGVDDQLGYAPLPASMLTAAKAQVDSLS